MESKQERLNRLIEQEGNLRFIAEYHYKRFLKNHPKEKLSLKRLKKPYLIHKYRHEQLKSYSIK